MPIHHLNLTARTSARVAAVGAAAALSLVLAACSGGETGSMSGMDMPTSSSTSATSTGPSSTTTSSTGIDAEHNAQDVMFAQMMIVHHQGAIEMSKMAATQASSQQVKDLAAMIKAAQQPEIEEMTSWLNAWGAPITADSSTDTMGSMEGMDHSSTAGMAGMSGVAPVAMVDPATCAFDFNWYDWAAGNVEPSTKIVISGCALTDWNATPSQSVPCQYARGMLHLRSGPWGLDLSAEVTGRSESLQLAHDLLNAAGDAKGESITWLNAACLVFSEVVNFFLRNAAGSWRLIDVLNACLFEHELRAVLSDSYKGKALCTGTLGANRQAKGVMFGGLVVLAEVNTAGFHHTLRSGSEKGMGFCIS